MVRLCMKERGHVKRQWVCVLRVHIIKEGLRKRDARCLLQAVQNTERTDANETELNGKMTINR